MERHMQVRERFFSSPILQGVEKEILTNDFDRLEKRYGEPHRFYHTLEHIEACLKVFDIYEHLATRPNALELAIIYHDLCYEIGVPARSNEEASALALAEGMFRWHCSWSETFFAMSAVLATTHDHMPSTSDNKLIVDIDLSGLGAPWEEFLRNNENIRAEYSRYSDKEFREGNTKVLQQFLNRTPLYYHPEIEERFGKQAKGNLSRWLNRK